MHSYRLLPIALIATQDVETMVSRTGQDRTGQDRTGQDIVVAGQDVGQDML